jgi:uncharacterized coiled-coil protein SlyX
MDNRGRKAPIMADDIVRPEHLNLIEDKTTRQVVAYRWGLKTGRRMTQDEVAEALGITKNIVRRHERDALDSITAAIKRRPSKSLDRERALLETITELDQRVAQLEDTVRSLGRVVAQHSDHVAEIDELLPRIKTRRKARS